MWNKITVRFLFLILAMLPGSVACSRQDVCEEKMLALEGIYYPSNSSDPDPTEDSPFNARFMKSGEDWVFTYVLTISPDNGPKYLHQFEQRVVWSPELNDYLFDHLSESDYELLKVDHVVMQYQTHLKRIIMTRMNQGNDGPWNVGSYTWSKLR